MKEETPLIILSIADIASQIFFRMIIFFYLASVLDINSHSILGLIYGMLGVLYILIPPVKFFIEVRKK